MGKVVKEEKKFSIMKGVAIMSVVIGHCTRQPFAELMVNQYHLAVFFFVAGYFFKEKYVDDKKAFVMKRVKSLYFPFVLSGVVLLLLHPLLKQVYVYSDELTSLGILTEMFNLTVRLTSNDPMMGAMWFCSALLMVSFMSFAMFCFTKSYGVAVKSFVFIMAVALGGVSLHVLGLKSPYCIWQYMIVTGIYYLGWLFHQYEEGLPKMNKITWGVIACLLFAILYALTSWGFHARLQPANINQENIFTILFVAAVGCMFVYALSNSLSKTSIGRVIAVVGEHSFAIMLLHFLSFKIVNWLYCVVHGLPMESILSFPTIKYNEPFWFWVYLTIGVFIPVVLSTTYRKCKRILVS